MFAPRMKLRQAMVIGWLGLGGLACNSSPTETMRTDPPTVTPDPEPADARVRAPKPDMTRLNFDESTQVLQLYDLPENGACWMVALPAEPGGVPTQGDYKFSKRADPKTVSVYYTLLKGGLSNPVSLQEIVDSKKPAVH